MNRLIGILILLPLGAFAGDNTGARFVPLGKPSVAGVGPGQEVGLDVQASGLVAVKNLEVVLEVSNPAHFDVSSAKMTPGEAFEDVQTLQAPKQLERDGRQVRFGFGGDSAQSDRRPGHLRLHAEDLRHLHRRHPRHPEPGPGLRRPEPDRAGRFPSRGRPRCQPGRQRHRPPDVATSLRRASWGQVKLAEWER